MRVVRNVLVGAALVAMSVAGLTSSATAVGVIPPATTVLTNNVPHFGGQVATGVPSPSQLLNIGVLLTSRNAAGLSAFVHDIETPGTAAYGHPLSPAAFNGSFGVEDARGQATRSWLTAGGLRVPDGQPLEGRYLLATGTVATVSSLLGVRFSTFKAADGSSFIANVNAPTVPSALGVVRVLGLNTSLRFHTLQTVPISMSTSPKDLWQLYDQPDLATNGAQGQQVATLLWGSKEEFDPTVRNDLVSFEDGNGLPHVPLSLTWQHGYVDPGAASDTLGSGLLESDLDAQASTGMAPYVSALTMYNSQDSLITNLADVAGIWANDPSGAMQMSASFGGCETLDFALEGAGLDSLFQQAVAEGRTVFVSTGDTGAGCGAVANVANTPLLDVEYPASSPYVVAVGGTVVTETTHTSPTSEYAWNGTGGGTSLYEAAPPWQQTVTDVVGRCLVDPNTVAWPLGPSNDPPPLPSNVGVPCRGVPDVAAQSGDLISGYNIVSNGTATGATGTSLSAPLWQGMWARVQAAVPAAKAATGNGFAAPILYDQAANHPADFNDITVGDNGPYPATPGWDYVSGWGSPDLSKLMLDIDGGTVAGGGSAPPPPPPPPTPCASPAITDPGGDATQLAGIVDAGNPSASQDDLDVRSGDLAWNYATSVLTATIHVQNLTASPPNGLPTNEFFRFQFNAGGGSFYLSAQRSPAAAGTADPSAQTDFAVVSNGVTGSSATITGAFDEATNTVTITMPATALASIGGPTLKSGDALSALSILAQRSGGVLTLTADDASASPAGCGYVLPSAPAPTVITTSHGKGHTKH